MAYASTDIPDPNREFQTEASYVYYADGKTVIGKFATQNRDSIDLEEMGQHTANAVVAAEDRSFFTNNGIDVKGILRAAFSNASGNSTQGASTITQQYVKVLYLTQERSYSRKIKEAMLALKLSNGGHDKDEILQGYLNTIYFGRGAYGIEAAAQAYFGKSASNLNLARVGRARRGPQLAEQLRPGQGRGREARRCSAATSTSWTAWPSSGNITASEYAQASGRLPKFPKIRRNSGYVGQTGYIMQMVRDELHKLDFSDAGDRRQRPAHHHHDRPAGDGGRGEDGVAAQRPEGLEAAARRGRLGRPEDRWAAGPVRRRAVRADRGRHQLGPAGQAPGSTFKAFALAAGLVQRLLAQEHLRRQLAARDRRPRDRQPGRRPGRQLRHAVSLLTATQKSINTAYVDLTDAMEDGPQKVIDTAVDGSASRASRLRSNPDIGVALGSADIRPIDMANAYATIANGGVAKDWYVIEQRQATPTARSSTSTGCRTTRALEEDVANDVSYALQQVVKGGTGTAALSLGRAGRGQDRYVDDDDGDVRASWFVGFTPQLATAVMYVRGDGNDPLNGYMPTFYGGEYPARTWTDMMSRALEGEPIEEFPPPGNVEQTAEDHLPAPTFTPKPTPPKPSKTETPTLTSTPTPTLTLTETPTPTDSPTFFPTDSCTPCDDLICPEPPCPPGGGDGGAAGWRRWWAESVASDEPAPQAVAFAGGGGRRHRPSLDDPMAAEASEVIGGPIGARARPHPWWTPVRIVLALACVTFLLGMLQKTPCVSQDWTGTDEQRYGAMCYSDVPYLYAGRGFAERVLPFTDTDGRYQDLEYPVVIGYFAYGAAVFTHLVEGWPDLVERQAYPDGEVFAAPGVNGEKSVFFVVTAILLAFFALACGVLHGRCASRSALGRPAVRRLAGAGADRPDQLGLPRDLSRWRPRCSPGRAGARCWPDS